MRLNAMTKRILFTAGALALVVLIVLAAIFFRNKLFGSAKITMTEGLELSSSADLHKFAGGFVGADGSQLTFFDAKGKASKTKEIPTGADAVMSPAGKSIAIYHDETMYLAFPGEEVNSSKPLNIAMSDIVCSAATDFVALLNDERNIIYILNEKGTKVDELHFADQTIINMGWFTLQRELLWVVAVDVTGSSPMGIVRICEPGKTDVALRQFTDEIVYDLVINTETASALAVGTKYISSVPLSTAGTPENIKALVYGYQFLGASDNGSTIIMAPADEIEKSYVTSMRIVRGNTAVNIQLPAGCSAFCVGSKNIYAADAATVYTIGFDGQIKDQMTFDVLYNSVKTIGNKRMMMFSGAGATLVNLPD